MKRIISMALFFTIILVGCSAKEPASPVKVEQVSEPEQCLRITTTNKLLYYMVKDIVKDRNNVDYMMLQEDEQWKYEFTEDALSNIASKDLFIYFGGDFEPWVDGFVDKLTKSNVSIINCSRGVKIGDLSVPRKYGDKDIKSNPYYYMDSDYYEIALSNIKNAIQEKDPKKRSLYEDNFNDIVKKLKALDEDLDNTMKELKDYTFVTDTDNLDYLLKYAGIKPIKLSSSEDIEVSKSKLGDAKDKTKGYVFLYSNDDELSSERVLVEMYGMKSAKLDVYSIDKDYLTMLADDYNALEALISNEPGA